VIRHHQKVERIQSLVVRVVESGKGRSGRHERRNVGRIGVRLPAVDAVPQNVGVRRARQFKKAADGLFSTAVSVVRQPIESFFNWLIQKTDIQNASKVRNTKGLLLHTFGAIASALFFGCFNP